MGSLGARRRGVSEVFSAILLVTVVAAVGISIYLAASSQVQKSLQAEQARVREAEAGALGLPSIYYAYIHNSTGQLWIVIATGPANVTVYAVYLDDQPVQPVNQSLPVTLPADTVTVLGPFEAGGAGYRVRVSTSAGDVEATVDVLP